MIKSDRPLHRILADKIRESKEPLNCVELMDMADVRDTAVTEFGTDIQRTTNKVSDALGFMWRKGLLNRYPSIKDGKMLARFSYTWNTKDKPAEVIPAQSTGKTGFVIRETDDGGICIEFDKFVVTVKPK